MVEERYEVDNKYEWVEFAEEEAEEKINVVLQHILLTPKEKGQNLFISHCSINNKICNLIIDNGSCESLLSRKLVEHF